MRYNQNLWIEINFAHLRHNIREIRKKIGKRTAILAVVKSDAYGHGLVKVARHISQCGIQALGVTQVDEAEKLRKEKIKSPIIILSKTGASHISRVIRGGFIQVVGSYAEAALLSQQALKMHKKAVIHLKIDTGMNRLGFSPKNVVGEIKRTVNLRGIEAEGIVTHFIESEKQDSVVVTSQLARFEDLLEKLNRKKISFKYQHCANSGALFTEPESYLNYTMVRIGLALYGYYPMHHFPKGGPQLKPLLSLKSRIIHLRTVAKGETVSYGGMWKASRKTRIAVIPVGYGAGYPFHLSNRGYVLVKGKRAPIIGRVCMNHTVIKIDALKSVREGDQVVLYGKQGKQNISIESVATSMETIPYEITCRLKEEIKRFYLNS